ncbi:MAG: hypothetical protein V1789_10920 [PVC group bacterium]
MPEDLFISILTFFSGSERYFTADTPMADVETKEFDERKLWLSLTSYELTLGVDITKEMVDLGKLSGMTIGEFARAAAKLPKVRDSLQIARFVQSVDEVIESFAPEKGEEEWLNLPEPEE